ncbi:gustatory receptor 63a [Arctopsyche grandis]|uniref:gustatory receptor 63a n=1 Tax=Arctopsyche grandis TaxID=121162 RepID=UPI00406D8135
MYNNRVSIIGDRVAPEKPKVVFLDVKPISSPEDRRLTVPSKDTAFQDHGGNFMSQPQRDIVYENIKPVVMILRALGVLPITRPKPGLTIFALVSPAMAYSCFIFIALIAYIIYISMHRGKVMKSAEGRFEEAVIAYLFTVQLFPLVMIPIMWYETKKIAEVLNSWSDFEICYRRVSGKSLPLGLNKQAFIIAIAIPLLSTTSVFVTHATMIHFKLLQMIPYVFLEMLTYILGGYWYLLCESLSSSATILAEDFQQALKHIGPASSVSEYRALWLRLSKLARDTGVANCYTFTFINLYLFLIITLSIYGLMSQISEGFGVKDIGLAVTACYSICLLFYICDEAHYASQNVRTNFQKKLLMVELSWMNSDAQTEINMFLRATEMNPSAISLGGFFDVNRNLFKSLLATMVTYLVVLLQFQISIPEDTSVSTNITMVDEEA